ncbi:MAG: glycosyltransferase family 2 protein [Planctomycetes bacterium]|nr:glycosyltransferase family 2 protein [Planctomycetota bacterium]
MRADPAAPFPPSRADRRPRGGIDVVIPALDEEGSIAAVVASIPRPPVREVIVVDNGSRDRTAEEARAAGARVVREPRRGYGAACLRGISALRPDAEVVAFLDGDGAVDPRDLSPLLAPILNGSADLSVGSRSRGIAEGGALAPLQRIGNAFASWWLRRRFGAPATDLGPFRAVRVDALRRLGMSDQGYGWTIEMQLKAARLGIPTAEVPVRCRRRRNGRSKVSGTFRGTVGAAAKILGLLLFHSFRSAGGHRAEVP